MIFDQALVPMTEDFTQLKNHSSVFGSFYNISALQNIQKGGFLETWQVLEAHLEHACSSNLCGTDRAGKLGFLSSIVE